MAQAGQAATLLTGDAIYTPDAGSPVSLPQSTAYSSDVFPSTNTANSNIFGHALGFLDGSFGTRGSVNGVFSIDSFSRYETAITNTTVARSTSTPISSSKVPSYPRRRPRRCSE